MWRGERATTRVLRSAIIARLPIAIPSRHPIRPGRASRRGSCRRRRGGSASARRAWSAPPHPARRSARRAARAAARPQSAAQSRAAAAGRPRDRQPAGARCRRARPRRAPAAIALAAVEVAHPECEVFARRSATASARPGGRDNAPARRGWLGVTALQRQPPAVEPDQPGDRRSSDDLPAPFGPLTRRASPASTAKLEPGKHRPAAPDAGEFRGQKPGRPPIRSITASCDPISAPGGCRAGPGGRRYPGKPAISAASC